MHNFDNPLSVFLVLGVSLKRLHIALHIFVHGTQRLSILGLNANIFKS